MKAIITFGEGFEEVEALAVVDVLRRGGIEVVMASISEEKTVTSTHGIKIQMDALLDELEIGSADAIILPGGMPGTTNLRESDLVQKNVKNYYENGKIVAAICAAPTVLGACGILKGKKATCYPGCEENLNCEQYIIEPVVVDDNIITSRGVGTALDFALKILEKLTDLHTSEKIRESILLP